MSTMAEVARRAGVALSTVSYVLSGKRPVSEETRKRVLRIIAEMDYHPSRLARRLARGRSKAIALLMPAADRQLRDSELDFIVSAADAACRSEYGLLLWTAPSEESAILRLIEDGFVEGLIVMEVALHDPRVEVLKKRGYPFTMIGRCECNDGPSFVDLDLEHSTWRRGWAHLRPPVAPLGAVSSGYPLDGGSSVG
jgi:DNA-binding LacI/PurR family transcriptional regulator